LLLSFEESLEFVDAALYLAKAKGRNRAFDVQEIVD
jgi:PleD family two-component response regulator